MASFAPVSWTNFSVSHGGFGFRASYFFHVSGISATLRPSNVTAKLRRQTIHKKRGSRIASLHGPTRTKEALAAAKRRGVKLGNPQYETAISKAVEVRQKIAADRNAGLRRTVAEVMEKTGLTKLAEIAEALNLRGIRTPHGCEFSPTHIHRLLKAA